MEYRLAGHVRACSVDGQVILLDLHRNRYLGVGGPQVSRLADYVVDWPGSTDNPIGCGSHAGALRWLDSLRDQDMLAPVDGTHRAREALNEALDTVHIDSGQGSGVDWRRVATLARAALGAAYWLRRLNLAQIANRVASLRPPASPAQVQAVDTDLATAVATFERLRPLLFTAHDQCLHDSLSLTRFLAHAHIFPAGSSA